MPHIKITTCVEANNARIGVRTRIVDAASADMSREVAEGVHNALTAARALGHDLGPAKVKLILSFETVE